ncbi:HET-C-related protein [Pseudomonas sp. PSKL.D1]|uniref:HET-C-related protein n=1 Tax=Pseudomonas sp. PSKL.D1 TaxID=3029060 RepID=UPI002381386B|nr:HET-C-related protein [Pseudomonas sp. PSKL.D1]WDY57025.1 hypothetical protein PVV54_20960 [Pseudomonas sp. PSKL.D1]
MRLPAESFRRTLTPVFGSDLPARHYNRLHTDLCNGELLNPACYLTAKGDALASYDNATRTIYLHPDVITRALEQPDAANELLTILLHEFGHHVDNMLRQPFATSLPSGEAQVAQDAALEEGARFAHLMGSIAIANTETQPVARYFDSSRDVIFRVDGLQARDYIWQSQDHDAQHACTNNGTREGFSAGSGNEDYPEHSWGHGSIEEDLKLSGFNEQQRKAIYFGNWLRDYSQLIDPKLVRAPDAPKDFPAKLSREVLTQLVDLLALKAFPSLQSTPEERAHYTVTPQMLGVYRPSEHIDNPYTPSPSACDPRTIDEDFEAPVGPDDPLLQVDPDTSMKRYIFTSVDYMCERLRDAMAEGPTPRGLREFGAALHVLEDFFAHSNYAELSLRKLGHEQVLPWTGKADCKHEWPVVTGMFAGCDVIASLAEPMANILFKSSGSFESVTPGQRADSELALLILLRDHPDPKWQEYLQTSLEVRDTLADIPGFNGLRLISWIVSSPIRSTQGLMNMGYQTLINLVGNTVDDYQTICIDNPNTSGSTNPTHSQLAKDHDVHPLHTLASLMARVAVRNVGLAMNKYWEGGRLLDPAKVARSYFTHPNDSDWQDELVEKWASDNRDAVARTYEATCFNTRFLGLDTSVWERMRGLFS